MGGDCLSHRHRRLDLFLHQFKAFKLHLPATDIQRRDNLIVRRGGGVGHVGFVEGLLDLDL